MQNINNLTGHFYLNHILTTMHCQHHNKFAHYLVHRSQITKLLNWDEDGVLYVFLLIKCVNCDLFADESSDYHFGICWPGLW
jgi:hypothetical protein